MKQVTLFFTLLLTALLATAQNLDTAQAETKMIRLSISTPQPRLDEPFTLTLDVSQLRAEIFRAMNGKVRSSSDLFSYSSEDLTYEVTAIVTGNNEIGPLHFVLNNTKYITNKLVYDVAEALPNTDQGLWFRSVMTGDTTFCIIIEQHIPADTDTKSSDMVKLKTGDIKGISGPRSNTFSTNRQTEIHGKEKKYMYGYAIYYFTITDFEGGITFTKDNFENLPKGYSFENIVVQ